ncbi:uncharacterized protein LOC124470576 [Hypomesus transpacificus]|uniref:uncharacterized protein LOC124470576 n=1 Tax=Hypomesus transpacificus TaxID=137520 RepID=UPI001F079023|nr:uncharacterized protein LOC124470576 [Hypomesus transpacificus]XP_046880578.1 uncharacterized protein LOC124470576 [Hypomesus transpacificus]
MDACVQKMVPVILRVLMLCSCLGPLLLNPTPLWCVSAATTSSPSTSAGHCNTTCPKVSEVNLTSPSFDVTEGDDITMECEHNLPLTGLKYEWQENNITMTDETNNTLTLTRLPAPLTTNYSCSVISCCGTFTSMTKTVVVKDNSMVILVVCAVLAVVFILAVGVGMKFYLKRENVRSKENRERNNQQFNRGS